MFNNNSESRLCAYNLERTRGISYVRYIRGILMRVDNKAFTFTEILVVLVITAIVVLMIGAMATLSYKFYNGLRTQSDTYNSSLWALQLMRENVRQASSGTLGVPSAGCLTAGSDNFYLSGDGNSFIYGRGCGSSPCVSGNCTGSEPIITCSNSGLTFTPTNTPGSRLVGVVFQTKNNLKCTSNGVAFSYTISVARRNP